MAESTWDGVLLVLGEARTPRHLPNGPANLPPIRLTAQDMVSDDVEKMDAGRIVRHLELEEHRCVLPSTSSAE